MDDLYWQQSWPDKASLLAKAPDAATKQLLEMNFGPWDRLNEDTPILPGIGPRPVGGVFYPADMTKAEFEAAGNPFMVEVFNTYSQSMAEDAFTPPLIEPWIEVSNVLWPKLQAAIVGDMTAKEALDAAQADAAAIMQDAGYN